MTETSSPIPAPIASSRTLLQRVSLSLFLFSFVLTGLLALSASFLLPELTKVTVGGKPQTASQLRAYQASLITDLQREEELRNASVLPFVEPAYDGLKEARRAVPDAFAVRNDIIRVAQTLVPEQDAVHVSSVAWSASGRALRILGDVRNVGPRSMTVLAEFVSELGRLPAVSAVKPPEFRREENGKGEPHSPFEFSLTLR